MRPEEIPKDLAEGLTRLLSQKLKIKGSLIVFRKKNHDSFSLGFTFSPVIYTFFWKQTPYFLEINFDSSILRRDDCGGASFTIRSHDNSILVVVGNIRLSNILMVDLYATWI